MAARPKTARLRVATCQMAVTGSLEANARRIRALMRRAARAGARVAHFPEACLSGYPGTDLASLQGFDWEAHRAEMIGIQELAAELGIWVVVGSSHPLTPPHKPHNSLYLVDGNGRLAGRYDKRFCTQSDLKHYSPGDAFVVFDVDGVRCGLQICYDFRFQELYREYYKRGVRLMLHSFYQAGGPKTSKWDNVLGHIAPATLCAYAANNHMWISAPNAQTRHTRWASVFILPDGRIQTRLPAHRNTLAVSTVEVPDTYYDAPRPFRDRAIRGLYSSVAPRKDPRSLHRTRL